jgi:dTDP-4-dehydrorhamnose reductase
VRLVVTGGEGQVVRSFIERAPDGIEVLPLGRPQFDLAGPSDRIIGAIETPQPDVIVSAAACPTPAKRPANSRLDCTRLAQRRGVRLPRWEASMKEVLARLFSQAPEGAITE